MFWPSSSASYRCLLRNLMWFGLLGMKEWRKMIARIHSFIPRKLKASLGGFLNISEIADFGSLYSTGHLRACVAGPLG